MKHTMLGTKFIIDARFTSRVERTERVLEVAEAFGLGLTEKEFVIYDGLEVEVKDGDVVYITGQSGSGKSLMLRELARQMAEAGEKVMAIEDVVLEPKPLVDQVGENMNRATMLLATAGINDAYLLIRKPEELSDGQRYRLRLAKLMESDANVWVADEFGAVLDRETAKVVAFNLQKAARRLGKTLIVATTHTDLEQELGPDLVITKLYKARVEMRRPKEAA